VGRILGLQFLNEDCDSYKCGCKVMVMWLLFAQKKSNLFKNILIYKKFLLCGPACDPGQPIGMLDPSYSLCPVLADIQVGATGATGLPFGSTHFPQPHLSFYSHHPPHYFHTGLMIIALMSSQRHSSGSEQPAPPLIISPCFPRPPGRESGRCPLCIPTPHQDAPVVEVPLAADWSVPPDTAHRMNAAGVRLTFLVSPHAPSGTLDR